MKMETMRDARRMSGGRPSRDFLSHHHENGTTAPAAGWPGSVRVDAAAAWTATPSAAQRKRDKTQPAPYLVSRLNQIVKTESRKLEIA